MCECVTNENKCTPLVIKTADDCEQLYKFYKVENAQELAQKRETSETEYLSFFTNYC